jgi:hypothetical protein
MIVRVADNVHGSVVQVGSVQTVDCSRWKCFLKINVDNVHGSVVQVGSVQTVDCSRWKCFLKIKTLVRFAKLTPSEGRDLKSLGY